MGKSIKRKQNYSPTITSSESIVYNKKRILFLLSAILVLTVIVFSNSIHNDFTNWDDNMYVTDNIYIKDFSVSGINKILFGKTRGGGTRLTYFVFALEYKLWKLNPVPYHVINLLFHLFNIVLVFFLALELFKRIEISTISALFFAIHPMHVESVAWISQLKDVFYTFFFLLSLIAYIKYIKNRQWIFLLFSFVLFFLSSHAKLSALCLPFLLFLFDYYYKRPYTKKLFYEKLPCFLFISYMMLWKTLTHFFLPSSIWKFTKIEVVQMAIHYNYFDRFFLACYSFLFYIAKFFAPFRLSSLHPYPPKTNGLLPIEYYISPFILTGLALLIIWRISKIKTYKREIIFSLLFFFVSISMFSHLIPIKGVVVVADRYTYVPYIGLFFIIGHLYCLAVDKKINYANYIKTILLISLITSTVVFSYASWNRNKIWTNSITLFSDVIEKNPQNDLAYINRGNAKKENKDFEGALKDYEKAAKVKDDNPYIYNNRGTLKAELKDYQGAMDDFNKAIELHPNYLSAYSNRAKLKRTLKNYEGMMDDLNTAIKLFPKYELAYLERGSARLYFKDYKGALNDYNSAASFNATEWKTFNSRGNVKTGLKDYVGAISDFTRAIELNSSAFDAYNGRGYAKKELKDIVGALNDFTIAIKLNPSFAEAYNNYGLLLQNKNDYQNALSYFNKAIVLNTEFTEAYNNRAVAYSNLQYFPEAMQDLNKAIELNPQFTEAYNNRGNLRAYYGDYQGSIEDLNRVIEINPENAFAYHNRGNSKFKLNRLKDACEDWKMAFKLGLTQANSTIEQYCK